MDFEHLRRSAGTALIGIDPGGWGLIVRVDHALADLLASTPETLVGTMLCDHVHPADRRSVSDAFAQLVGDPRSAYEGSWQLVADDGALHRVSVTASVIVGDHKRVLLIRVTAPRP